MLLTEEQAREKWCPEARIWSADAEGGCSGGWNRHPESPDHEPNTTGCRCLASDCMFWRWPHQVEATDGTWNVLPNRKDGFSSPDRVGYCGKGGRP